MLPKIAGFIAVAVIASAAAFAAPRASRSAKDARKLAPYNAIVVKPFAIEKYPSTADAPDGLASAIQKRAVQELEANALFDAVIDASPMVSSQSDDASGRVDMRISPVARGIAATAGTPSPADGMRDRRLILHCEVVSFSRGNRAARYLAGFGAGESKLKARFTLTDEKTGADVLSWEQTGTFKGMLTSFGGGNQSAVNGAANSVVKGMIKQIEKNR
ncbi:MAG: DUF4410 domain-containing protein [Candidatus Acidiferrales bacterium]